MASKKSVSVYLRADGQLFIQAYSTCGPNGPSLPDGPVSVFSSGDDSAVIGQAILDAQLYCREDLSWPEPDEWSNIDAPLLRAANFKSGKALEKACKTINIKFSINNIILRPYKALKNGYEPLIDQEICLKQSELTPALLGSNVLGAFLLCR